MSNLTVQMEQQSDGTYTVKITKPGGGIVATESGLTLIEACQRVDEIGGGNEAGD